jgi:hypothetical protein
MSNGTHVDRRFDQTQHEYAATDLETIEEARRYGEYVFGLFRPFLGRRHPRGRIRHRHDEPQAR